MKKPAVTPAASAAADDNAGTQFLPEDKNYRLTGELPADSKDDSASSNEDEELDENEGEGGDESDAGAGEELDENEGEGADTKDDSASSNADTAAASAAASAQKKTGTKTKETSESRWQKITRENRELREKLARHEGREEGRQAQQPRDTAQGSQPAAAEGADRPEPKIDDVDPKTNKPKYANIAEYLSDLRKWDADQLRKEFAENQSKAQRDQQLAESERIIEQTVNQRAAAIRKVYPDFDDLIADAIELKDEHGNDAFFYPKGSPIDGFFLDSDRSHEIMYAIAKDFDKHRHIFARDAKGKFLLSPVRQLRELAKIENSLPEAKPAAGARGGAGGSGSGSSSAKPITQAPRPPHQTSGTGSATKDPVEKAVEENDFETYAAAQNARALERRRATKRTASAR